MIKLIGILFASTLVINSLAYAEKNPESVDQDTDQMMDDEDHSSHDMDHSEHTMDHGDSHDMTHGDGHMMDESGEHSMDHEAEGHTAHHGDGHHHEDGHIMDHEGGMIMGQNFDKLPSSCDSISEEIEITVRAGKKYAEKFPGTMYAFDKQEWRVKPCAKITWRFINDDDVRHQFMMHGLPRYLYNMGMFHLEVTGPKTISGTMIVPASDETYLVHCDISQHMEKGMKAQLVVGNGGEDLTSIPGLTPYAFTDTYRHEDLPQVSDDDESSMTEQVTDFFNEDSPISAMTIIGLLLGLLGVPLIIKLLSIRKKSSEPQ